MCGLHGGGQGCAGVGVGARSKDGATHRACARLHRDTLLPQQYPTPHVVQCAVMLECYAMHGDGAGCGCMLPTRSLLVKRGVLGDGQCRVCRGHAVCLMVAWGSCMTVLINSNGCFDVYMSVYGPMRGHAACCCCCALLGCLSLCTCNVRTITRRCGCILGPGAFNACGMRQMRGCMCYTRCFM